MKFFKIVFILSLFFFLHTTKAKADENFSLDKLTKITSGNHKPLFELYYLNNRYFISIPEKIIKKDMLWCTEIAKVPSGILYNGVPVVSRVIRWEKSENSVYLVSVSFSKRIGIPKHDKSKSKDINAIKDAVSDSSFPSIIKAFPIVFKTADNSNIIEVTSFLNSEIPEFSIIPSLADDGFTVGELDKERSYTEKIQSFSTNLEIQTVLTYPFPAKQYLSDKFNSATFQVHHSIIMLPEEIMKPRLYDNRVGFFTTSFEDYSGKVGQIEQELILRYRLEKKYPDQALSEPIKQVIYYISKEVPQKWRPFIKKGVEDWNPAFEKAGFKNALVCKESPSLEENPEWNPSDAQYSLIKWAAAPLENAMGPNIHDPRSGEIISSNIVIWNDMIKQLQYWYYTQCSNLDPRAIKFPLPDELTGELLRYIVSHEIGHSLGLRHNYKASSTYSIKNLRDPAFTDVFGSVSSIMSYGRFNYVAQPEDKVKRLIPLIGPYDQFAIEWGYRQFHDIDLETEKNFLERMLEIQKSNPYLLFGGEDIPSEVDPTVKTENIGDDPVEATRLGLKNLEKALENLPEATALFEKHDFEFTKEVYNEILETRKNWFDSIIRVVGGVIENKNFENKNPRFKYIAREKQKLAMDFVLKNAFNPTPNLVSPNIINNLRAIEVMDLFFTQQSELLENLLSPLRVQLIADSEIIDPENSYKLINFFTDIQNGIWNELKDKKVSVNWHRKELQRIYLKRVNDILIHKDPDVIKDPNESFSGLNNISISDTDANAIIRKNLFDLQRDIRLALKKSANNETIIHLEDCNNEISKILKI